MKKLLSTRRQHALTDGDDHLSDSTHIMMLIFKV